MVKKRFNVKGRRAVETTIENSKKIDLDLNITGNYDESNPLVLPSKKRKTKVKEKNVQPIKLLSRKRRKHLEKIVATKHKKENRANLLKSLAQVQATPDELKKLTSLAAVQTKGLKRFFQEQQRGERLPRDRDVPHESQTETVNSLRGAKRRRIALSEPQLDADDPNVVGFESSGSEDEAVEEQGNTESNIHPEENNPEPEGQIGETSAEEAVMEGEKACEDVVLQPEVVPQIDLVENEQSEATSKKKQRKQAPIERKPAVFVPVARSARIQKARLKLPILAEEQQIMEAINENPIVIIAGETGSGKTTQVPQFLYEAGYALKKMIGVTEPRRVAATAMSQRVGEEMDLTDQVSYLIRFEGNVTDATKIKFMTDGVLLKEVQSDFLLSKYSVIILDEAHERSVYTDILIGLLSRIVPLRAKKNDPLKLIIMSATLRIEDFTDNSRLFKRTPPVLKVDARQYPVTVHFNKRTPDDYVTEAFKKALKIHTTLPEGGILIFVTGQQEVKTLVRRLRRACPLRKRATDAPRAPSDEDDDDEKDDEGMKGAGTRRRGRKKLPPKIDLDDYSLPDDHDVDNDVDDVTDDDEYDDGDVTLKASAHPIWVLPLYSLLPNHKQRQIFHAPPPDHRLCIVSTNVAETSLTIPRVKYVIDCGKCKHKLYDKVTGVVTHAIDWTSKACANQRAGRAGRTGPGHCYRLYSSAVFNDLFIDFNTPDIQRKPVDDLYLQMKCMRIARVAQFPFPTAPDALQLRSAEHRLELLGALEQSRPTALGEAIAHFPVLPRYGKMLALSHQHSLLAYTICLIAALSVQEVLLERPLTGADDDNTKAIRQQWGAVRRKWAGTGHSLLLGDLMVLLRAIEGAERAHMAGTLEKFCTDHGLRHKAVQEIRKLRVQLTNETAANVPDAQVSVDPRMTPPGDVQAKLLRQIVLAGMCDQVARKIQPDEVALEDRVAMRYAYRANNMADPVYLHQGTVLRRSRPEYVVYQEIYETKNKMYMRGVTAIEPEWLPIYVPALCNLSAPLPEPSPRFDAATGRVRCTVNGSFGTQAWPLPRVEIEYPRTIDAYKWFAKFLLDGSVYGRMRKYTPLLLSESAVMVKVWARLQPRTGALLKALQLRDVSTRAQLEDVWRENDKYLLAEYLGWLPESAHNEVALMWPPWDTK